MHVIHSLYIPYRVHCLFCHHLQIYILTEKNGDFLGMLFFCVIFCFYLSQIKSIYMH